MLKYEELIKTPEYWFDVIQNEIFRHVKIYMETENINQSELAEKLCVTKGYVSQILNGNSNFTLKKLAEISLKINLVPQVKYQKFDDFIREKSVVVGNNLLKMESGSQKISLKTKSAKIIKFNSITDISFDNQCVNGN